MFLLGLTTGVAGLLGIPFPNGLIPQAPFHTNALCVTRTVAAADADKEKPLSDDLDNTGGRVHRVTDHVVEQRFSNLAQGLLTLGTMTGPILVVLHLIPQGILAGLFFVMGVQALQANGITAKLIFLFKDKALTFAYDPLRAIHRKRPVAVWMFVVIELLSFGATFAITQTIAAIGFPVMILLLIPVRTLLFPRIFRPPELAVLDAPTASPFTMESCGGVHGLSTASNSLETAQQSRTTVTGQSASETDSRNDTNNKAASDPNSTGTSIGLPANSVDAAERGQFPASGADASNRLLARRERVDRNETAQIRGN